MPEIRAAAFLTQLRDTGPMLNRTSVFTFRTVPLRKTGRNVKPIPNVNGGGGNGRVI